MSVLFEVTKRHLKMKLAILGLLVLGQTFAAPSRIQRDAPILPAWDVPAFNEVGVEGRSYTSDTGFLGISGGIGFEVGSGLRDGVGLRDEYGVPHDEYGVPHEEYGPPPEVKTVTEHYCPEEEINAPFVIAPPAPEAFPLLVPTVRVTEAPYPAPEVRDEYGPPTLPVYKEYGVPEVVREYGVPEVVREYVPFVPAPPAPSILPLPVPFLREETLPYPAPEVPHEEYGPPPTTSSAPYPPPTEPPTTTEAPPPPTPAPEYGPPPTTSSAPYPPSTTSSAPYPPPTEPPTTTSAPAPYPSFVYSKYETDSGLATAAAAAAASVGGDKGIYTERIVPAVRAPAVSYKIIKPKVVYTKKTIQFPSIIGTLAKLKRSILHAKHW